MERDRHPTIENPRVNRPKANLWTQIREAQQHTLDLLHEIRVTIKTRDNETTSIH